MIEVSIIKGLDFITRKVEESKLPAEQLAKIAKILDALDAVTSENDIKALGSGIHQLSGNMKDFWSIKISANYRIVFRFEAGNILDVDYLDYH
jgi:proteic killer suppression protein